LGFNGGGVVKEQKRGISSGRWPQASLLPSMPSAWDKWKRVFEDPWTQREIPSRSFPPLGRLAKEIRERERRD
jgi:hypothetical protein